jgi:23S rRNA (guanosine2251-2'-O)-methyltransferase
VVRPAKGKKKKAPLMGSHQRCWIWGRMSVVETLRAARWPILELHLSGDLPSDELDAARRLADSLDLPTSIESARTLSQLCHSDEHQGYLAKMPPFPYDDAEDLLRNVPDEAFYVLLDAVQDPFNFGAILRSADALGVDAVFIASHNQVDVTSLVVRASAGAVNYVPLAKVDDLAAWIGRLKATGLQVVGTSPRAKCDVSQHDFRPSSAVILGNEAVGIRPELLALCDDRVSIRQRGHVGSLNAAVSAGILFYEISRQRDAGASRERRGGPPERPDSRLP